MSLESQKLDSLPESVRSFIRESYQLTTPAELHLCDGSESEKKLLIDVMVSCGTLRPLKKYRNCYIARTNPLDVARVESRTYMCTSDERSSVTMGSPGCNVRIGNWCDENVMRKNLKELFQGCMTGRIMYALAFCMGPLGSSLSKIGFLVTDSPYVVVSMGVMSTIGSHVHPYLKEHEFTKCLHSVGLPIIHPNELTEVDKRWPCNPEKVVITQFPNTNEIITYGSGYGGNSLVGKKCFALRIASNLAKKEGWLAEHMLIMGLTSPENKKIYIAAAFPSSCGKTNLAMMTPSLPGWKATCIGDDIAWMRFDEEGVLRAINPERGFFGICNGTSHKCNPVAMDIVKQDTIFTNVCETSDGGVFWEGLEGETDMSGLTFTDWQGKPWDPSKGTPAAHPNSRFCSPITSCPILDEAWNDPKGVPISAIIFGGRRPHGPPLVFQTLSWSHGVLTGASLRSETTAAASDVKAKVVVHDPFAMRPFFGYNCGDYMQHWLDLGAVPGRKLPKIFHVNWFLRNNLGQFLWPGFGENSRVLKWIHERCHDVENYITTPIGYIPEKGSFDISGMKGIDLDALFQIDKSFWKTEVKELRQYFESVIYKEFPSALSQELAQLESRLSS